MENPIEGLAPDFSIFGAEFTQLWQKLLVAGWALAIIIAIAFLLKGIGSMVAHRSSGHPRETAEARADAVKAGIGLVGLAAFGTIVGAILFVVG